MARRILALIIKELLAILKDPKSRFVLIGPPLIQMLVFGYGASFDLNQVPCAVYDEDNSAPSRDMVSRISGSPNLQIVTHLRSDRDVEKLLDQRRVLVFIHIPRDFHRRLALEKTAPVQVIIDGRNSNTALIALNFVRTIVDEFNRHTSQQYDARALKTELVPRAWYNPNIESRWFLIPGVVGLITIVVTTIVSSLSIAREKEDGTFDQLLVTPFRPFEILVGKALPGFAIGFAEATVVTLVAVFWFKVPFQGNVLTFYTGLALFLLSTIGIGLMISSLAATMQQALLGSFLFLVPAVILSGFSTPISNMPGWIQNITLLDPMRYFMVVLRGVFLEASSLPSLAHQLWPMGLIGVVNMTVAAWLFRRRVY
jgi:ABC-2 type transport system permease protein